MWTIIFVVALAVLLKASDVLTDSASKIASYLGLPAFIIGVTVVSVGSSLPELTSSIAGVLSGSAEIPVGGVIGSNIANILLVIGIAAIISRKLKTSWELVKVDLPMLVGSALFLAIVILDGKVVLYEALLALSGYALYLHYTISTHKERWFSFLHREQELPVGEKRKRISWQTLAGIIVPPFFIYLGAKYSIEAVIHLSELLNIGRHILAVSSIALGTSLPELAITAQAGRKGKSEMAIGNVLGSNIFNSFAVIGGAGLFGTLLSPQSLIVFGLPVMIAATLMYYFITQDKEVSQWEGWLLLLIYIAFIGVIVGLF